jgi:hypothetical protein
MAEMTKLGRYQLKQVLGRGAMGVVYEGLDPSLGRRVAVKTILKNAAIDEETARAYSAQFAREAQAAGRLNHPNIVQVHDFAEEGEIAYLVMEYIQGRELRSFFEAKERFEVAEAVRIMGELLDALDFAHDAGVIHRDVKPANVMLDAQRRVKLADFGVARIQDSERSAAGTMVGTPAFMSPEQISGGKIDRRTDVFSAGTILYQLLTGDQPFTGAGAWTVAKKIMQDDPPQPSSVVKSVSPVFDAIVNKALAKKQADRYASAKEFAAALRGALAGGQPSAMASLPPGQVPAQPPKAAPQASETEIEFWKAIQNSTDAAEFEFYLEQFPEGTYAALARHKIARLRNVAGPDVNDTVRLQAQAEAKRKELEAQEAAALQARAEAEAKARWEAAEKAQREAAAKAQREAAEKAQREAAEKAKREAETRARVEAELKARKEAEEKTKREAQERARQAEVLARLKAQEASRATADPEATIAISRPAPRPAAKAPAPVAAPAEPPKKSFVVPAIIGAVVVIGGVAAFFALGRKPAPAPAAEAPAPVAAPAPKAAAAPAAPVVDEEKIRREVEERIRREYADKSAAEQAAAAKAASQKAIQEKQQAAKSAVVDRAAAEKAAAAKAAAEKALAEQLAAAKSAGEKAALERVAAERAAAEKAAAEKAAAEKAAAEKAAAEKAAAEKAAAEKAAAEKQVVASSAATEHAAALERFIQRKGADKVLKQDPPFVPGALPTGQVVYVDNGRCGPGYIREVTGGNMQRNTPRAYRCIRLE